MEKILISNVCLGGCTINTSKTKINVFFKKISTWGSPNETRSEEIFSKKTLILVFEIIVQPPKHTFEIGFFLRVSSLWNFSYFVVATQNSFLSSYNWKPRFIFLEFDFRVIYIIRTYTIYILIDKFSVRWTVWFIEQFG